jgi:LysM repeat protein
MVGIEEDKKFIKNENPKVEPTPAPTPPANNDVPMDMKPPEVKPVISKNKPTVENKNNLAKEYTVKHGDTIYSIAKKYKLDYNRLLKINNIQDPNKIKLGQKLKFIQ